MEQILQALYKLQQIDLELDELEAGSGDLPSEIHTLETELAQVQSELKEHEGNLSELRQARNDGNMEMQEIRARQLELTERLGTVRNNKEYDATSSDIESADQRLSDLTSTISGLDHKEAEILKGSQALGKRQEEINDTLEDKRETLDTIQSSSSDEIDSLKSQRVEALAEIPKDLLGQYDFVRKRFPDAVVKARKGACSGCFKAITPQSIVELRRNEQAFTCEHCSRIIVDEELAEAVEII